MQEEMHQHLDRATERLMGRGLSPEKARRAALREFGNVHYLQEEARDARGGRWLEGLTPDARLALRMLIKSPLLSVVGGLGMAVAIAIATGFFTFMTYYYSDAPVEDGDRVVTVGYIEGDHNHSTLFDYRLWKDELESIEDLAAYRTVTRDLERSSGGSGRVKVAEMTASGFRVSRVPPLLGRPLVDTDELEGAPPVVVIGYREWHRWFGGDPDLVGRDVRLDGTPHTVVGVMPEDFRLPVNHGLWTPLGTATSLAGPTEGGQIHVFGRLAPGVETAVAQAEAAAIGERMIAEHPQIYERLRAVVLPYIRHVFDVQQYPAWAIWLMQLFAALILAAIAINVAVLFYARTALRRAEITVRTALGASRSRIVTQLFLEALALSTLAAGLGLVIAQVGFGRLMVVEDLRDNFPYWLQGALPPETIVYAAGLAALAACVVGVLPALRATGRHLESTLREMGGGTGMRLGRTWTLLICVQVAVAVGVLPAVVGVAWNYAPPPTPTYPASEVLRFELRPGSSLGGAAVSGQPGSEADLGVLQAELLRRVEAIPGLVDVTFTAADVLWGHIELEDPSGANEPSFRLTGFYRVDPEYFDALGVSLLRGRPFDRNEAVDGGIAAIVNRAFVDEYFAGGAALGRRFREVSPGEDEASAPGPWFEIVGVIENMLRPSGRGRRASPRAFHPMALGTEQVSFAARTRAIDPAALAPQVREIAAQVAPDVELWSRASGYEEDPNELRLLLLIVGLITLSVLLLSAAGISAMMSFAVTQRQREVGIRTALGASRGQVIWSIFSRSTRQLGIGLLIGAVGAALLDQLTGGDMLGGAGVPLLALVAAIMLASGLLATLGPACRALRIQPMEALREE